MSFARVFFAATVALCVSLSPSIAATSVATPWPPTQREDVLQRASGALDDYYFSAKIAALKAVIARNRAALLAIDDEKAFASALTSKLQAASGDRHIIVWYSAQADPNVSHKETEAEAKANNAFFNYVGEGYGASARLDANVGYLALRGFADHTQAKSAIDDAMRLLAHTSALIVDMRGNRGGDSDSVNYLLSYFFPGGVELMRALQRTNGRLIVHRNYTAATVGGPKYLTRPVYVLIGPQTISGGEMFAYEMQTHKRAPTIGVRTVGAANGLGALPVYLNEHLRISVPDTMLKSPITGTNWEGGVRPDVAAPVTEALLVAYKKALAQTSDAYDPLGELEQARKDPQAALRDSLP